MKAVNVAQLEFDTVAAGVEHGREMGSASAGASVLATCDSARETSSRANAKAKARLAPASTAVAGMESLLTFAEAARVLGISLRQFRRLVDGGIVTFVRVGERSPRIRPSELQRFLAASVVKYEVKL